MKLLTLAFILFSVGLYGQNYKTQVAQQVFNDIVNAYGNSKSPPQFKILPKTATKIVAQYISYPNAAIQIDEDLYNICASFGKDSLNALAIVISHELAHYYNDHNWCSDYAFALQNTALGKTLNKVSKETKIEKESIADSYGLFYCCIAGYQPFNVFNNLLDKIYRHYKLSTTLQGYPTLNERKAINKIQKEKIEKLVPVFDAGVVLLYIKKYTEADACFDYLTKFFPSREMYNNLGVAQFMNALNYKQATDINFIYPVDIDIASRIYQSEERGTDTTNKNAQFVQLIQQAKASFEKAINLDNKYIPAYINLACLQDAKGNYQSALGTVEEANNYTTNNDALQLIKAIALYNTNQTTVALQEFKKLNNAHPLNEYNYQLATNAALYKTNITAFDNWKEEWLNKHIKTENENCMQQAKILPALIKGKIAYSEIQPTNNLTIKTFTSNPDLLLIEKDKLKWLFSINKKISVVNIKTNPLTTKNNCLTIQQSNILWNIVFKETANE